MYILNAFIINYIFLWSEILPPGSDQELIQEIAVQPGSKILNRLIEN